MRFSLLLISTLATLTYFASAIPVNGQDLTQPQVNAPAIMMQKRSEDWDDDHDDDDEDCEDEDEVIVSKAPKEKTIYFFHTVTATTTITQGHDHEGKHDRNHGSRDRDHGDRREWEHHGFDLGHLFDHHRELNVATGASVVAAAPTPAPVSV